MLLFLIRDRDKVPAEERWQHEYPHNRSVCVCVLLHLSCETCKHARGRRALTKINQKCDGRKRLAGSPVEISDRAVSVLARCLPLSFSCTESVDFMKAKAS